MLLCRMRGAAFDPPSALPAADITVVLAPYAGHPIHDLSTDMVHATGYLLPASHCFWVPPLEPRHLLKGQSPTFRGMRLD